MKLGFVSSILENCSFEQMVDTAAEMGFQYWRFHSDRRNLMAGCEDRYGK